MCPGICTMTRCCGTWAASGPDSTSPSRRGLTRIDRGAVVRHWPPAAAVRLRAVRRTRPPGATAMTEDVKDRWASGDLYEPYVGRCSRLVARGFLAWLNAPAGLEWLDVGCGTGELPGGRRTLCAQAPRRDRCLARLPRL